MRVVQRGIVVLLVLGVLVGVVVVAAESLLRDQAETAVSDVVGRELRDLGAGFASVTTDIDGSVVGGVATGSIDSVRVRASDGELAGVPVQLVEVTALGLSPDGRRADSLRLEVRLDAGRAVASRFDPAVAEQVSGSARLAGEDTVTVTVPVPAGELVGEALPGVEVDIRFRVTDGGVVAEPVAARLAGLAVDLPTGLGGAAAVQASELPAGLRVDRVEVVEEAGRPVLVAYASCTTGCALR